MEIALRSIWDMKMGVFAIDGSVLCLQKRPWPTLPPEPFHS